MHGGDIYNNKIEYDFSVNLNPFGPYREVVDALRDGVSRITEYPEYESRGLKEKISEYNGVKTEYITVTNGASEGILTAACAVKSIEVAKGNTECRAYIESPAFYGYEYACNACSIDCDFISRDELLSLQASGISEGSLLFIANPSNPVGEYITIDNIIKLYEKVKVASAWLIIDESFLPISDYHDETVIKLIRDNEEYYERMIVIRSFTKSYAIPGIRLGYILCANKELSHRTGMMVSEWNVSVMAQVAGEKCLECADRLREDAKEIRLLRQKLAGELKDLGLNVYESTSVYILFSVPDELGNNMSKSLYKGLLDKGILIRDCGNYRNISEDKTYRVAVRRDEENSILVKAIRECIKG